MMTLPIQSVKFVMPFRKFIEPRVSHHRNNKLPKSGYGEKCAGAADEPNRWPSKREVDDGADYGQAGGDRHNSTCRVCPGALKHGGRAKSRSIVPPLEKRRRSRYCQKEHRTKNQIQGCVSFAEIDHRTQHHPRGKHGNERAYNEGVHEDGCVIREVDIHPFPIPPPGSGAPTPQNANHPNT